MSQGTQVAIQIAGTSNRAVASWRDKRSIIQRSGGGTACGRGQCQLDDRGHCLRRRLALKGPVATREFVKHYAKRN